MSTLEAIHHDDQHCDALIDITLAILSQALDLLRDSVKTDAQLTQESKLIPGGSIGKHFRHVVDHFRFFTDALPPVNVNAPTTDALPLDNANATASTSRPPLHLNYDVRIRKGQVESSIEACTAAYKHVGSDLDRWRKETKQSGDGKLGEAFTREIILEAVTPVKEVMGSTVGRELWFVSQHAIHHFAMLRIIAVHEIGLDVPLAFGTAPSTLLYREQEPPMVKSKY